MMTSRWTILLIAVFIMTSCGTADDTTMYDVTVATNPSEAGTVSPSGSNSYEEGETITFTAEGETEYAFENWSGTVESTDNPLSITVDKDYSLTANFAKKEYQLTIEKEGDGKVFETQVSPKTYEHGAVVELSGEPADGYEFVEWSGDLSSSDNPKTIVMDGPKTVTAHFEVKSDKAAIKINVNWESLDSSTKAKYKPISDSVTHFGARLVYPVQNAVFQQSVEKVTADSMGVITMGVPAADTARLLVAAVRHESGKHKAFGFGVLEDLTIENGTAYEWNVDDISWVKPSWKVVDSLATDYENGTFIVDKDQTYFDLWYLVRTPYITELHADYEDLIIKLSGTGGNAEYHDGYREFQAVAENPTPGTANEESYSFFPWLDSEKFNLPNARYVVEEKGSFTVSWE